MTAMRLVDALPSPVGFVFGGGGSLGAIQVGMLQAINEHGVHAGLVTGTSIGAINGAIVAADPIGGANRLSHVWAEIDTKALLPGGILQRIWTWYRKKTYLFETAAIDELFEREIGDGLIEDLPVPYAAMSLDIATSRPVMLREGRLSTALRASSAIPGIFPPVERDGLQLYDGGIAVNVPVLEALDLGARSLVVFDCAFADQTLAIPADVTEALYYSMTVQTRQQAQRDMPIAAATVPVVYLPGPAPVRVSPLDFGRTTSLVRDGYESSRAFLATLDVDGPGMYRSLHID